MTSEQLLRAIGEIEEARLEESEPAGAIIRKLPYRRYLRTAIAACACLLILFAALPQHLHMGRFEESSTAIMTEETCESADSAADMYDSAAASGAADSKTADSSILENITPETEEDNAAEADLETAEGDSLASEITSSRLVVNGKFYTEASSSDLQKYGADIPAVNSLSESDCGSYLGHVEDVSGSRLNGIYAYTCKTSHVQDDLIIIKWSDDTYHLYMQTD